MVKIERDKIVKAAIGSARLEGYKGTPKVPKAKPAEAGRSQSKTRTTAKR